jgi:hypothetical protein
LHGLLSRVIAVFRKRPELSETKIEAEQM